MISPRSPCLPAFPLQVASNRRAGKDVLDGLLRFFIEAGSTGEEAPYALFAAYAASVAVTYDKDDAFVEAMTQQWRLGA